MNLIGKVVNGNSCRMSRKAREIFLKTIAEYDSDRKTRRLVGCRKYKLCYMYLAS